VSNHDNCYIRGSCNRANRHKFCLSKWWMDTDVYMTQSIGFVDLNHPDWVCKLKKSLYDLKQADHIWYDAVLDFILELDVSNLMLICVCLHKEVKKIVLS
jgi:hypothetical protein